MTRHSEHHPVSTPVPSLSSKQMSSSPATEAGALTGTGSMRITTEQSNTSEPGQPKQTNNTGTSTLHIPSQPSQGTTITASTRRPVIHTPRSRRTHVSVRQPPASKNLRWTASAVHSLLSSHPSLTHDANLIAARVAALASHATINIYPSKSQGLSKPNASSSNIDELMSSGCNKDLPKDKRKRKKKLSIPDIPIPSTDAEAWSCISAVERNARRRVYDTLKVMASAGCLLKQGKHISWIGVDHLRRPFSHPPLRPSAVHPGVAVCFKRYSIARKRIMLAELQRRVRAFSQLHRQGSRTIDPFSTPAPNGDSADCTSAQAALSKPGIGNKRRRTQAPPPRLDFPFLLIRAGTPEVLCTPDRLFIRVTARHSLKLFSETDVVCLLADRRLSASKKLRKTVLPSEELMKSCDSLVCAYTAPPRTENGIKVTDKSASAKPQELHKDLAVTSSDTKALCGSRDREGVKSKPVNVEEKKSDVVVAAEKNVKTLPTSKEKALNDQEMHENQTTKDRRDGGERESAVARDDYDVSQIVGTELNLPTFSNEDLDVNLLCPLGLNTDSCDGPDNDILGWIKDHTGESFG